MKQTDLINLDTLPCRQRGICKKCASVVCGKGAAHEEYRKLSYFSCRHTKTSSFHHGMTVYFSRKKVIKNKYSINSRLE